MIIAKKKGKMKGEIWRKGVAVQIMGYKSFKNVYRVSITHGNADNMLMLKIKAEH